MTQQNFIDPLHMFNIQNEKIGKGGFGEVLKAIGADGKEYAVKRIPKSRKQEHNIAKEVGAGLRLTHKNIVNYTTTFHDSENDYLVFEYVPGTVWNFHRIFL